MRVWLRQRRNRLASEFAGFYSATSSAALAFDFTCSGFLQPGMSADTTGFFRHQAIAHFAIGTPGGTSSFSRRSTSAMLCINFVCSNVSRTSLVSKLTPDLYLPLNRPLASGLLSGKYKSGVSFDTNDVRETFEHTKLIHNIAEVERLEKEEVPPGVPMAKWAMAWCLKNPVVSALIPGCKNPEQVKSNASAAELVAE